LIIVDEFRSVIEFFEVLLKVHWYIGLRIILW